MALGQMTHDFWIGPRKPCITGIKQHLLMKHLKINMKLRQFLWITNFSDSLNYLSLCGGKSQLARAKRPNAAWKRVKRLLLEESALFNMAIYIYVQELHFSVYYLKGTVSPD
jgi:hypothetical protein